MGKNKLRLKLKDWKMLVLIFGLLGSLGLNFRQWQDKQSYSQGIAVEGVIDGDTLVLEGKVRLRLRNVDAPELKYCGGKEAKELLESLVINKKVVVKDRIIDNQGRPMAVIYADGEMVNEIMLAEGWGRYHSDTNKDKERLKAAYLKAREEKLGLWGWCHQTENVEKPECNIKGNMDKNAKNRKLYYYPGCPQYNFTVVELDIGEEWFCSKEEAETAGYTKAKNCP